MPIQLLFFYILAKFGDNPAQVGLKLSVFLPQQTEYQAVFCNAGAKLKFWNMLGKSSTTEMHPQPFVPLLYLRAPYLPLVKFHFSLKKPHAHIFIAHVVASSLHTLSLLLSSMVVLPSPSCCTLLDEKPQTLSQCAFNGCPKTNLEMKGLIASYHSQVTFHH